MIEGHLTYIRASVSHPGLLRFPSIYRPTSGELGRNRSNVAARHGTARRRRGRPREPDRCDSDGQLRHAGADAHAVFGICVHQGCSEVQDGYDDILGR